MGVVILGIAAGARRAGVFGFGRARARLSETVGT
jgi:hypothetical protein